MRAPLKKILIALIVTPLVVAALVITTALIVLNYPTLILGETTLNMAVRHLHPLGIKVQWKTFTPRCSSHGFLDETIGVTFEKLCVEMPPTVEKACFDKLDVAARYRFRGFMPELIEVGPLDVQGGDVVVNAPEEESAKEAKDDKPLTIPPLTVPDWLKRMHLHAINIALDSVEVHAGETTYQIKANVAGTHDEKGRPQTITATISLVEKPAARTVDLEAVLASPSAFEHDDWELQATVNAKLALATKASIDAKLNATGRGGIDHLIEAKFSEANIQGNATLQGTLTEERFSTKLIAEAHNLSDVVRAVKLPACTIDLKATELLDNRGELHLDCPVDVILKKFELPDPEMHKFYRPPERVRINITASANTFFMPDLDQKIDGTLELRLQPIQDKLIKTHGGVKINFAGIPSQPIDSWSIESDMDIDFTIDDVSNLIAVLATTKYPAPAPFNKLTGSIEFSLEGHVSSAHELGRFPAKLTTRLKSPDQQIDIDSEGELSVGFVHKQDVKDIALKLDVRLSNVQLQLPDVAMAGIPRFAPDGRIILNPEEEKEAEEKPPVPFDYDVNISTPPDNPVRILSNITPEHIPIHVDVNLKNDAITGTVMITQFPIQLFSRSAYVEKLALALKDPTEESTVDGKLTMQFPELKIIVDITGTVEKPSITINSDPSMSQGDIVSTLLYGEPLTGIDSDQASSVNNMNAAMADRAMALTSFFLLGSTPIQSIAYNPESKMFSARVRLGKRMSFGVGASGSQKTAGIRTRLGKGFSISTSVDQTDDEPDTAASAMIEWSKRF